MFFKERVNKKEFKKFSVSLLANNNINNFMEINNWFLESIKNIDQFYLDKFKLKLNDIDVNFGSLQCGSIDVTLKKINQNNLDISYFLAQTKKVDEILISYDNPFLNQENLDCESVYEAKFIMMCPYEYKDILIEFITKDINLKSWSYGYGMSLVGNQNLDGSQVKSTLFSNKNIPLVTEEVWDNLLLRNSFLSESGFVKDIYEFNILNTIQVEKVGLLNFLERGVGKFLVKGEKYFWILNFSEINLVKKELKNNSFLISN